MEWRCTATEDGERLEISDFRMRGIVLSKTKVPINCAVTAQLICAFVFANAKSRVSHDQAHISDASLKSLAQEVLDLLKKVAGVEKFTEVYAGTQKVRAERKGERKRKQALQVSAVKS